MKWNGSHFFCVHGKSWLLWIRIFSTLIVTHDSLFPPSNCDYYSFFLLLCWIEIISYLIARCFEPKLYYWFSFDFYFFSLHRTTKDNIKQRNRKNDWEKHKNGREKKLSSIRWNKVKLSVLSQSFVCFVIKNAWHFIL